VPTVVVDLLRVPKPKVPSLLACNFNVDAYHNNALDSRTVFKYCSGAVIAAIYNDRVRTFLQVSGANNIKNMNGNKKKRGKVLNV